jgi:hypothetical protein
MFRNKRWWWSVSQTAIEKKGDLLYEYEENEEADEGKMA